MPIPLDFGTLREALKADPYTEHIIAHLTPDPSSHPDLKSSSWPVMKCWNYSFEPLESSNSDEIPSRFQVSWPVFWSGWCCPPIIALSAEEPCQSSQWEAFSSVFWSVYNCSQCRSRGLRIAASSIIEVHPIFHVSLLRPAHGCPGNSSPPLLPLSADLEFVAEPEKVLSHHWRKESMVPTLELLIQWRHRPVEEASWEDQNLLLVYSLPSALGTRGLFRRDALVRAHLLLRLILEGTWKWDKDFSYWE